MVGIPPAWALALGCLVGVAGYGPVKRWTVAVRQAFRDQFERPDAQRKDSGFLLLLFATMHPAPWVLILGIPFFAYSLIFDPLRMMWLLMLAGVGSGVAAAALYAAINSRRAPIAAAQTTGAADPTRR